MGDEPLSLAERMRELQMRDVAERDEDAVARAKESKAQVTAKLTDSEDPDVVTFAQRLRSLQAQGLADTALQHVDKTGRGNDRWDSADHAEPGSSMDRRARMLDWLLGRRAQELGKGDVTFIPSFDPKQWEEVEFYSVDPPFAFVRILRDKHTGEMIYEAIEPVVRDEDREVLDFVEEALVRGLNEDPGDLDAAARDEYLSRAVRQILSDYRIRIDSVAQARLEYYVRRDFLGMGPIHVLMRDANIEDISCDGPHESLFVFHREHETISTNIKFLDDADLDGFVIRMAQRSGKAISISDPILDAALPDGSRLQATLGREVTENGSTFTIRRFKPDPFTPIDLVRFGSMSVDLLAWFWMIVQYGYSLIFSGGTASGKTTALNAICQFIPHTAKLVSIEDTREVNLPHKNWIKSVTRSGSTGEGAGEIGMFELLKAALRQRPEYILVGEVRGVEATVAFQAMATGHTVYSTMHADSARSVVYRLENDPINIPRLVLQALDVIAIQAQVRVGGKRARRVREVVELVGMDPSTRELLTNTVFHWNAATDEFQYSGRSYLLEQIAEERNWTHEQLLEEFAQRKRVIRLMDAAKVDTVDQLTDLVRAYTRDAASVVAELEGGGSAE